MEEFAIQYIGAWHSHHQLGLQQPSNGDIQAAEKYLERHKRSRTIEIIVTNDKYGMNLNIIPYYYDETTGWQQANFRIINKISPIREKIIREQQKQDNDANKNFNAFNNQPAYNSQQRQQLKEELESEKPVTNESLDTNESRRITIEAEPLQEEKSVVPILIQIEIQILSENKINVETEIHDDYYILVCEISKAKSVAIALRYNNPFKNIVRIDLINRVSNSNIDITEQIKNIKPLNRLGRKGILLEVIDLINENYFSLLRRVN
jgi:hypothetical protein